MSDSNIISQIYPTNDYYIFSSIEKMRIKFEKHVGGR